MAFLLLLGGGEGAGGMTGGGPGFRRVLFCLQIRMKIITFNSMKNNRDLGFCRKSL